MGVKKRNGQRQSESQNVSIPFSSGHGGKGRATARCQGGMAVSIPFSSGHGGKVQDALNKLLNDMMFLSLFHQVMGVKRRTSKTRRRVSRFLSLFHQVMGVKGLETDIKIM